MRVLVDLTNSPHVPLLAPVIRCFREDGHTVDVLARHFAQTIELARLHELNVTVIGAHGGTGRLGKARAAVRRTWGMWRYVRAQQRDLGAYDIAISHGSTDLPIVSRLCRIPHVTAFDYEWARTMHRINCRLSWRVVVPDSIPLERLDGYGAAGKVVTYPGLKEEYYLDEQQLDPAAVRDQLNIHERDVLVVLRPPADMALYHRGITNDVFASVLERVRDTDGCVAVVLARTQSQREQIEAQMDGSSSVIIPKSAVDGASLVAAADIVVSAGGTMNREAAALGVPVYTVFAGRIGGVDEQLLNTGRLRLLASAQDVQLVKRRTAATPITSHGPRMLASIMTDGVPSMNR